MVGVKKIHKSAINKSAIKNKPLAANGNFNSMKFDKQIKDLSEQELKELLLINMYKLALIRAQLEAVTNVLIRNKIVTFEEIWKQTDENFKNTI